MKIFRQISAVLLAFIFVTSTAGIVIYQSNCACSGSKKISVYVSPDNCEDECKTGCCSIPAETKSCCENCAPVENSCACSEPSLIFLKLKNKFVDEEVKFTATQVLKLMVSSCDILCTDEFDENEIIQNYIDPPPDIISSFDFLIKINQLKIPNRT